MNVTSGSGIATCTDYMDDNPASVGAPVTNMFNLFDEYRTCAMKLNFIPNVTANATITQFYSYVPIFVAHDVNSTSLVVATAANILDYENCKVFNVQRPWKYYRKMQKNIAYTTTANSISVRFSKAYSELSDLI